MPLDFNQLRELLAAIAQTDIAELTLKSADFELTVRKGVLPSPPSSTPVSAGNAAAEITATPSSVAAIPAVGSLIPEPAVRGTSTSPPVDSKWEEVKSPMVGTFYRSPAPDEPPFVEVGDRIRNGQTVCIIEAMKLMNEIEAEISGQVMEVLVENGEPVEYGQPLLRINPAQ
ncbi:MAG: acetyl-CoA carboxylase biotin carboxyl carrier protein [Kastovskya adunca ATA6-11-RM4]|nr:acetyl-CoA carboxylase biotin carboxyl carrier protein [Kastovskya adunca ATA6-11-RM4]